MLKVNSRSKIDFRPTRQEHSKLMARGLTSKITVSSTWKPLRSELNVAERCDAGMPYLALCSLGACKVIALILCAARDLAREEEDSKLTCEALVLGQSYCQYGCDPICRFFDQGVPPV